MTCTFYVGDQKVEELTQEQLDRMSEKLSEAMSIYYSKHPDQFERVEGEES